ncbi:uncharacterized protein [Henckelia pumila]|uniref:uncharacterized protein n=1 Tax=Henckelia pumila TaxID=405737 RepID=UPI003C6E51C4
MSLGCFGPAGYQPLTRTMKAMVFEKRWFSRNMLKQRQVKTPDIKDDQVLINVFAVGVNRGDMILDTSTVCPGLECSGIIEEVGKNVNCWKVGDRVCAILEEGGGYAEQVAVPENFLLPIPDDVDLDDAASLPYASCTIWLALSKLRRKIKKTILIREGNSGIGALAIQYAKYMGFNVIASTGSRDSFAICHRYGADFCVDHTAKNFVSAVYQNLEYGGVDLVLDHGASDLERNIKCCRIWGKVFILDLHGMESGSIDLAMVQQKHIEIRVFDFRSRDSGYKASVIAELRTHLWPSILQRKVVPAIEYRFPVIEARKSLNLLSKDDTIGKIILYINFQNTNRRLKKD